MTRIFILTTFLLIGVLQSHGQRLDNLALECTVKDMDEGNKIEGASVIVLQDGAEIENVRTGRNGRFGLYLDFNHEFSIVISKNGFVTKNIYVNTHRYCRSRTRHNPTDIYLEKKV